jgi:cytoskeleton protein RodZ
MAGDEQARAQAAEPAQQGDDPPGVGEQLRKARKSRELTPEAAASALHLDPAILRALEAGDFARLGAPVFVRGHLRKYAQLLGLDPEALLACYASEARPAEPLPPRSVRSRERFAVEDGLNWPVVLVVVLVVAVAALAVWRLWEHPDEPVPVTTDLSQAWSGVTLVPVEPAVSLRGPFLSSPDGESAVFERAEAASDAPASGPAQEPLQQADPPGDGLLLAISFTGECWTEISDGSGRRLYFGMARAGQRIAVRGETPLSVVLGNAAAATVSVAGERWPLRDEQVVNNVARLRIDSREL